MMLQFTDIQPLVNSSEKVLQNVKSLNVIALYNPTGNFSLPSLSTNTDVLKYNRMEKCANKKNIYVCTFCQVFSPHLITVAHHISSVHFDSLPIGTPPENFISKLHSLEANSTVGTLEKKKGKVGRPRKNLQQNVIPPVKNQPVNDPVPDNNGLFWCKKCLRHFRKSRQLTRHICQDSEEEFSSSESSVELDNVEFRTYMDVDPVPWKRRKKIHKLNKNSYDSASSAVKTIESMNEGSVPDANNEITESKIIPNWRNDPSYVPLFDDEKEKAAFEKHLKSIDYSCVDHLFQVEEKRCRSKSKSPCVYIQSVVYTCNYCKKVLKSLSLIRLHCLIHTDLKPFTCPKCAYRSNSKGSLYMHMRTHTGNVFCCSFCDFKCNKRSHLLDHEATHSTVSQICKLCKNPYKTLRSLIAHIRKYHNYAGGKRYIKSLTSKQKRELKCDICNKKFKTENTLKNHNHACHENVVVSDNTPEIKNQSDQDSENVEDMQMDIPNHIDQPPTDLQGSNAQCKDPLADIVLNNFLQQEQSQTIMYDNVFNEPSESILPSSDNTLLECFQAKTVPNGLGTETSILEECQKTLNLDILNECLQNRNFSNECENFNLISNISAEHSLQNNNSEANSSGTSHLNDIAEDKGEEPKSVEIKLFEKCQRAPAYVCCVCSSIYICPSTLKVHLREHVNNTSSSLIDQAEVQYEPAKISETTSELDVCQILQDSSESCSYDEELEKLYTSSLDMMYYLPEVSVVLENDPALLDSMLDDISNFPISVSSPNDLNVKEDEDENILKCFHGL